MKDINGSYEVETISYVKTRRHVRMLVFNYVFIFLHTGLHRLLHKAYFFLTIRTGSSGITPVLPTYLVPEVLVLCLWSLSFVNDSTRDLHFLYANTLNDS